MINTQYFPSNFENRISSEEKTNLLKRMAKIDDSLDQIKMAINDGIKLFELTFFGHENLSKKISSLFITSHIDFLNDATFVYRGKTLEKINLKNSAKTMSVIGKTLKYGYCLYPFIKPTLNSTPLSPYVNLLEKSINTGSKLFKSTNHIFKAVDKTKTIVEEKNWSFINTTDIVVQTGLIYMTLAPMVSSTPPLIGAVSVITSSSALLSFLARFGSFFFNANRDESLIESEVSDIV